MSGCHIRLELLAHCFGKDNGMEEDSRLGDTCLLEILIGSFKHDVCDAESKNLIGFLKHLMSNRIAVVKILPHAYELGSLTGKHKCFHLYLYYYQVHLFNRRYIATAHDVTQIYRSG